MFGVALLTSTLLALADARIYERCELARELLDLGIRKEHIATWVCIAYHESRFDTGARNPHSGDHGLLQISELYWCGPGKACGQPCTAFRDEDISDDVECALQIHEEHTRLQGDGFLAWVVYPHHCKHNAKKYLADCDSSVKSSSVRTAGRARVLKPQIKNFTNNYAYYDKIDELLPPYLTVGSVVRGSYETQPQQVFNKKPRVNWFNYKLDNIDELKLPVFRSNFKPKVSERYSTTTLYTTTTTTPAPLPNIKPPSPRRIESNSFRRRKNRPIPEPESNPHDTTETSRIFVTGSVAQKNVPDSKAVSPLTTIRPSTAQNEPSTLFASRSTQTTDSPVRTTMRIQTTKKPSVETTARIQTTTTSLSVQSTTKLSTTTRPPPSPSVRTTTKSPSTTRSRFVQTTAQISTTSKPFPSYIQATTRFPTTTSSPAIQTTSKPLSVQSTTKLSTTTRPPSPPSVQTTSKIPTTTRSRSLQTTTQTSTTSRPSSSYIQARVRTTTKSPAVQTTTRILTTATTGIVATNTKIVTTKPSINLTETTKVNNVTLPNIVDRSRESSTVRAIQKSTTISPLILKEKGNTNQGPGITVSEASSTKKPVATVNSFKYQVNKSEHMSQSTTTTSKPQTRSWFTWRTSGEHPITTKTTTTTSKPSVINWRNAKSWASASKETLNLNASTTQASEPSTTVKPQPTTVWPRKITTEKSGSNTSTAKTSTTIATERSTTSSTTRLVTSTTSPYPTTVRTTQSIFDLYLNPTKRPNPPMFSFPPFKSSGHSFKIFAGGTTTNAPFFLKKEEPKIAPGEAAKNQIKRQAWQPML